MRILLVRPDGIGDQIVSLPVASALRRQCPEAHVTFLSSQAAAPVLQHHPDLDAIETVAGGETLRDLIRVFRGGYDAAIFLKPFRRLMLAAFLARIPLRVATGYRWYSVLANRRVYQHRSQFARHESEYNLELLVGLGLQPAPLERPRLVVTEAEAQWAAHRLGPISAPRVVVHPGGFSTRHWSTARYARLARRLTEHGYGVILTGNQAEGERFRNESGWRDGASATVCDLMGHMTVRQLMAIIASSQVLVSGATGPAHVAAALGVRTLSLFDPRRNNAPARWGPLATGLLLTPDVPTCEKCVYEACPYWDCLDRLAPDRVATEVGRALAQREGLEVVRV